MNHARLIYEDTPAFIPVPKEMQHRKTEITFLPMDDEPAPQTTVELLQSVELAEDKNALLSDEFFASLEKTATEKPRSLLELIGKGKGCFKNAAEIDAFIRAERDAWED